MTSVGNTDIFIFAKFAITISQNISHVFNRLLLHEFEKDRGKCKFCAKVKVRVSGEKMHKKINVH